MPFDYNRVRRYVKEYTQDANPTPQQVKRIRDYARRIEVVSQPVDIHPLIEILTRWWFEYLGGAEAFNEFNDGGQQDGN